MKKLFALAISLLLFTSYAEYVNAQSDSLAQPATISATPLADSTQASKAQTQGFIPQYRIDTAYYSSFDYDRIDRQLRAYQTTAIISWVGSLSYFGSVLHSVYPLFTIIPAERNLTSLIRSYEGKHIYRLGENETQLLALNLSMAKDELRKARRNSYIGIGLGVVGVGGSIASILYSINLWDKGRYVESDRFLAVGIVGFFITPYLALNIPPIFNYRHARTSRAYLENARRIQEGRLR